MEPNPALLALQATASSSLTLVDVPLEAEAIVTDDFSGFIGRSSFCWGLAWRTLSQTRGGLREAAFLPIQAPTEGQLR